MNSKKAGVLIVSVFTAIGLIACSNNNEDSKKKSNQNQEANGEHSGMDHSGKSGSGEVSEGLKVSENPTYKVGSKVIIIDGHMEGMKGAQATIVGAFDTIAYAISYNPTNGGERVTKHKWIIQEEIPESGDDILKQGTKVTVDAEHMEGMDEVKATIDFSEKTTVYMIDYTPTNGGEKVKNHKWVTESELSPIK